MARELRIKYKNALYHITSRGNERKKIETPLANLYAGLKGREIGGLIGLDYSTVSVGRKRLRVNT